MEALALLSRLPLPATEDHRGARAAWAYPLAGVILGAIAALTGVIVHAFGLPAPLTALVVLATLIATTGALHEDGLADTADGLWGGWTRERRLEIMKDSRIGAYGVIALILGLSARWTALWMLFDIGATVAAAATLVSCSLSRAAMPAVMAALPHARDTGLSHHVGQVPRQSAMLAAAIAVVIAFLCAGSGAFGAVFCAAAATAAIAAAAKAKIGGQTGDILGATQQLAEIAVLFSLVV